MYQVEHYHTWATLGKKNHCTIQSIETKYKRVESAIEHQILCKLGIKITYRLKRYKI